MGTDATPLPATPADPPATAQPPAWWRWWPLALAALAVAALWLAFSGQQRMRLLEQELVRRQQDLQGQAGESRALARQAHDSARDAAAKVALLEAKVAESSLQRSQLEELIQAMSRSRDENLLADLDAALRVAVQQSELTGGTEPVMTALRQADDRLARANQPRLERVRRAVAHDIDRVRAAGLVDIPTLTLRLDEAVRLVDEMPLLAQPERRAPRAEATLSPTTPATPATPASAATAPALPWPQRWQALAGEVWQQARTLVRVTRIEHPEAMLVSPEQAWYLRENLKLRLLNARLALMSRQFDAAQTDLRDALASMDRYFDRSARRVSSGRALVQQVAAQARQVSLPRPEETLSAITAVQAGR